MEEYVYEEEKYIKRQDLKDYSNLMMEYDFAPEEIQDENEFNIVFQYLVNLTIKAPDFLPAYENCLRMIAYLELDKEIEAIQNDIEVRWIQACLRIAEKENIFKKTVLWGWHENRPLVRGLNSEANRLWTIGEIQEANQLFSKILKTNENDNIGARYSVKATSEGMSYIEFKKRFTFSNDNGSYYKNKELGEWFNEE
jgi:hypothetical protein